MPHQTARQQGSRRDGIPRPNRRPAAAWAANHGAALPGHKHRNQQNHHDGSSDVQRTLGRKTVARRRGGHLAAAIGCRFVHALKHGRRRQAVLSDKRSRTNRTEASPQESASAAGRSEPRCCASLTCKPGATSGSHLHRSPEPHGSRSPSAYSLALSVQTYPESRMANPRCSAWSWPGHPRTANPTSPATSRPHHGTT